MNAAVITIGDEILIGQVVNTNASYLCKKLFSAGVRVERVITVADDEKEIISVFRSAFRDYDIVVVSGGLGPTHDDITKKCIAKFFRTKLVLSKKVLKHIRSLYIRRNVKIPDNSLLQAMIPENSEPLHNRMGTAPGILIDKAGKLFCALPGVPYELEYITDNSLVPYILKKFSSGKLKSVLLQKTLQTIGIPEAKLAERIGDLESIVRDGPGFSVKLAFLPSNYEVRLRITVETTSRSKALALVRNAEKIIKEKAKSFIYSYDENPIQKEIGRILRKRKMTLAVAESCTGGLIASKITDIAGSSDYFREGVVTYSNKAKQRILGVKSATLEDYGAVSKKTAVEMAVGIRKRSHSDVAISTTGIAGPSGGTKEKPIGLVWIGYTDKKKSFAKKFIFTKERFRNKEIMSKMALEVLRRELLGLNLDGKD